MKRVAPDFRRIALDLSPLEVAGRLRERGGLAFFDSAIERDAGISVVAAGPSEILRGQTPADWAALRDRIRAHQREIVDQPFPAGFAAGHVEYGGRFCFGVFEEVLVFDHRSGHWFANGEVDLPPNSTPIAVGTGPVFGVSMSSEAFCQKVRRAQEYIAAGDIYQVNLSHCLRAAWSGDGLQFYEALRHYSPAPQAAFLELDGRAILSSSPELFLSMSGRQIRTRPIKGTRPRQSDPVADERSAYDLITSPKEIAELVMITDLERNDLGRVCEYGSVTVRELLQLERYEQVFHLVSTVEGHLRSEVDHVTALRECFPGGSITGAPKKRAMEIIAELESEPRGVYTGAIGWFGFNGESQFNIAIRTVVLEKGTAQFHVGAGIVADSDPEREYQETLDKAAGILLAAKRLR